MKHIAQLPGLQRLALFETPITDLGIRELKKHSSIEYLQVHKTRVTSVGLDELQKANPKLKVLAQ